MYPELIDRRALVTGGTSGIGRSCVERLCAEGMHVTFTGRSEDRGHEVAEATGATFVRTDAQDRAASDRTMADAIAVASGRLDVLVANAGILHTGPVAETPEPVVRELLEVNLTAVVRTVRAGLAAMTAVGAGSIVGIASDAGIRGVHELPVYSASKAAVIALTELAATCGAPHGVRANAVCPGDVLPGVQATAAGHEEQAEDPAEWTLPPSGRFGTGQDISNIVAWLASDQSRHISGATLRADGATGAAVRSALH
jgi:NAD(P)-dependent dehydrogenase (short-subunit alcohol dehydrogenase family)